MSDLHKDWQRTVMVVQKIPQRKTQGNPKEGSQPMTIDQAFGEQSPHICDKTADERKVGSQLQIGL
jgi:hypothetical protein